jgi:peptidoglycan hydrolase-like protein with peptidoglycan-binding domain
MVWSAARTVIAAIDRSAHADGMPIPAFDPNTAPVLRRGSSGEWVSFLQGALTVLGYDTGLPDGDFGPQTEAAVIAFQTAAGLSADGVVGPRTWAAILAAGGDQPEDQHRLDPERAPLLRRNDWGDWVEYLQTLLQSTGEDTGEIDGKFGPITEGAVLRFQSRAAIDVDGDVGPQTWGALSPYAEAAPIDPPYGSPVHHGYGGSGGGGSGGGPAGVGGVTVAIQTAGAVDDGMLTLTVPVTNHTSGPIYVRHVEWNAGAEGRSVADAEIVESWLEPGETTEATTKIPAGPAPGGETYDFDTSATVVYGLPEGDTDLRSPTAERRFTVDDQGAVTDGGTSPGGGGGSGGTEPTGSELSIVLSVDSELDTTGDGLTLNFDVFSVVDREVVVTAIEWTMTSGSSRQTGRIEPANVLGGFGSMDASDVAVCGPAVDEPYACTAVATVVYVVGDDFKRSESNQVAFTIDSAGNVGPAGGGGGGSGGGQDGPPAEFTFEVDIPGHLIEGTLLYVSASVRNDGEGVGEQVHVAATLSGAHSAYNEQSADSLAPTHGIVAELAVTLEADRTDTLLFVLDAGFTAADGSSRQQSYGITVDPDGNVTSS